ncbi:ABC transporter permease [Halobacterium sp. R2-5]|uniref:ABC transporter permease n=1 Tax=Halobacterium sp. R2-5 TaxID=2715751 RepID=UPI00141E2F5C|nr:ABC transporter permease [Halobacterium sp. R2-5]NIB99986.1 ABC transporter permease subunit [Halobacterium sp. R2-5]
MVAALAGVVPLVDALAAQATAGPLLVGFPFESQYVASIIYVSLYVSVFAVCLSTLVSVPVALLVGFTDFPGKRLVKAAINTGMGFPSVVVGLVVLFAVSNQGPLGELDLVFTKEAMIVSQFVLATPPITGIALAAVTSVQADVRDAAFALGGTRLDVALAVVKEARYGIATAVLAGFGRAISEVGSVLIVGGNIAGTDGVSKTRTLTTAVQLEARQGRYETALVLGAVLVALVLVVNAVVVRLGDSGVGGGGLR